MTEPTVFVVDDDAQVRRSLERLVLSVGLQVRTFSTAQEFLECKRPAGPACVVLDVRMPGLSGLDLQEKLSATGLIPKPKLKELKKNGISPDAALRTRRKVYFSETEGFVECPTYDRYRLTCGNVIKGPAIVEDKDATTVIHPGYQAEVDRYGNLILTPESKT